MDNTGMLFSQVAAEAGCSPNKAKVAIYLRQLASQGKSVGYAASALKRDSGTIKTYAREFMIEFSDYEPFARCKTKPEPKYALRDLAA